VPDHDLKFSASASAPAACKTDCLILPIASGKPLAGAAAALDAATGGSIRKLLKSGDFTGKAGATLLLHDPQGLAASRLLLVGAGSEPLGPQERANLLATAARATLATPAKTAALVADELLAPAPEAGARLAARLFATAGYRYRAADNGNTHQLRQLNLLVERAQVNACAKGLELGRILGAAMNSARRLGDLPGNVCTPSHLADHARALAKKHPELKVQVLGEPRLKQLKMGALLSVTAGTEQPACLIALEYRGGAARQAPVVLVGKGVTFDSGGISLKPGAKMDEMKYDMCGAASVLGVMEAVAAAQLPIAVVGLIPAVENLPSGKATKPGDVVTSMSGKTIEILNTDAEGRLILCDALTYAARYKPAVVIDIATLTGACVVALGKQASGLFSNDDALAEALLAAGTQAADRAWRLPLWQEYDEQLKSNFADMANVGGPEAGSVTAACFLARFTKDYTWAHLDIAGTAWNSSPKGATGRPVPLLMEYLLGRLGTGARA
jgi:leucyl aminopeptidase